jgi:hypothetical protein
MTRVRRVGPLSLAKILGIVYAGLGFIVGACISVVAIVGTTMGFAMHGGARPIVGLLFGAGAVIVLPLLYGLLGFVVGAIAGGLYNLAARAVGGIELDLEPRTSV